MPIPLRELAPEQRGAIARDYGDHAITVAAILARHDIHHRTLYGLARAESLPLRRAEIAAGADDPFAHGRRQPRPERLTDEALLDNLERSGKLKRLRAQKVHELAQSRPAHEVLADFTRRLAAYCKGRDAGDGPA